MHLTNLYMSLFINKLVNLPEELKPSSDDQMIDRSYYYTHCWREKLSLALNVSWEKEVCFSFSASVSSLSSAGCKLDKSQYIRSPNCHTFVFQSTRKNWPCLYVQTFTYDFSDHEDEADGWGDVEFLLGHPLVHAVLTCQGFGTVAVGAHWPFQLDGTRHASIFEGQVRILLLGVWKRAAEMQRECVHKDKDGPPYTTDAPGWSYSWLITSLRRKNLIIRSSLDMPTLIFVHITMAHWSTVHWKTEWIDCF